MMDDAQLLRQFAADQSESAFAELVRRHLNLVYATALRTLNGDKQLAEDAAQIVFIALARNAARLAERPVLAGWLHTTTHHTAAKMVRTERRRLLRDAKARNMHDIHQESSVAEDIDWETLRPLLDDVLQKLNDRDREALLLRYFEGHPYTEIGARVGLGENAARMRVERALERLRGLLSKRGACSSASALGLLLAGQAGVAAPSALLSSVTSAGVASVAAGAGGAGFLALSLKFMGITKVQAGLAGLSLAVLGTGLALQERNIARMQAEIEGLRVEVQPLPQLRNDNKELASSARDVDRLRSVEASLAQLRGDVARVRAEKIGSVKPGSGAKFTGVSAKGSGTAYNFNDLDVKPNPIHQVPPVFPLGLVVEGTAGEVMVSCIVDADGAVQNASIVKPTDPSKVSDPEFEESALDAVRQWKFNPGKKAGQAVGTYMQIPIIFKIAEQKPAAQGH